MPKPRYYTFAFVNGMGMTVESARGPQTHVDASKPYGHQPCMVFKQENGDDIIMFLRSAIWLAVTDNEPKKSSIVTPGLTQGMPQRQM